MKKYTLYIIHPGPHPTPTPTTQPQPGLGERGRGCKTSGKERKEEGRGPGEEGIPRVKWKEGGSLREAENARPGGSVDRREGKGRGQGFLQRPPLPYSTWPVGEETDMSQQRGWLPGDRQGSQNLPNPGVGAQRHGAGGGLGAEGERAGSGGPPDSEIRRGLF